MALYRTQPTPPHQYFGHEKHLSYGSPKNTPRTTPPADSSPEKNSPDTIQRACRYVQGNAALPSPTPTKAPQDPPRASEATPRTRQRVNHSALPILSRHCPKKSTITKTPKKGMVEGFYSILGQSSHQQKRCSTQLFIVVTVLCCCYTVNCNYRCTQLENTFPYLDLLSTLLNKSSTRSAGFSRGLEGGILTEQ